MRELYKDVEMELDGKKYLFKIKKMDALSTNNILKLLTEKLLPGVPNLREVIAGVSIPEDAQPEDLQKIALKRSEAIFTTLPKILSLISEEEFMDLERKCLRTVSVMLPAGPQPVMINNRFGFEELEYESSAVLMLCYEVIAFNVKGFFGESSLSSFLSHLNISLPDA